MPVRYEMCETDVLNKVLKVMETHHPDLLAEKLVVDCVYAVDPDGAAITLHGYPCAATIKKIGYKQRVLGRGDAELTIDKAHWDDLTALQQEGLLDHELTHLELVRDLRTGKLKRDRAERPRLAMRLHDWEIGGFVDTAKRYLAAAPEVLTARQFKQKFGQYVFDFAPKTD